MDTGNEIGKENKARAPLLIDPSYNPLYTVNVVGIGTVNDVMIDSGSQCCVIRMDVLPKSISSQIKKTKATAKLSDQTTTKF